MMARSTKRSNQRPDTLMQDRISPNSKKSSCNARPDHTLGQQRTLPAYLAMSALPLKADMRELPRNVRFVPKCTAAWVGLFDHLVGAGEQRRWNFEPERSRGHEIDDEFELGGLHDRQVGRLGAFEDLTGIDADLTPHDRNIGSIAHQPAGFDLLASAVGRGNPLARRKRRKLDAPTDEERVGRDEQRIGSVAREGGECCLDLAAGAGVEDLDLQSDRASRFRQLPPGGLGP